MNKLSTKKYIFLLALLLPMFLISTRVNAREISGYLDYCSYEYPKFVSRVPNHLCYMVASGDTLWGIAEKHLGSGFEWRKLKAFVGNVNDFDPIEDPRKLKPGTKLVIKRQWDLVPPNQGHLIDGWGVDYQTGEIYVATGDRISVGNSIYDQDLGSILYFTIDKETNNKIYITNTRDDDRCTKYDSQIVNNWGLKIVFNKQRNPHFGCGMNFSLLTFSPDGKSYAIRNNKSNWAEKDQFIVLSNIGNGPFYDFSDSIMWYDNNTLIYRAQNNDEWRVVVNNKDYAVYDYLENLRMEDGTIKYDARHKDGSWTKEEITLNN